MTELNSRQQNKLSWRVKPLVLLIRGYQLFISPILGQRCRYQPSCSHYAIEALSRHGLLKGSKLAGQRLLRCHPWGSHGYDPVPPKHNHQQS